MSLFFVPGLKPWAMFVGDCTMVFSLVCFPLFIERITDQYSFLIIAHQHLDLCKTDIVKL
ncbi:hypothetical protein DF182_02520 [Chitinophaga flava]|uniref:Uncharacterized protein n=1 Tax=Chitinophaga flava TaxID=2259036 RepID=A0A365Y0Y7_9BACT|nr:hypothetical protein DF182_02520 [Chitinophaga flava]